MNRQEILRQARRHNLALANMADPMIGGKAEVINCFGFSVFLPPEKHFLTHQSLWGFLDVGVFGDVASASSLNNANQNFLFSGRLFLKENMGERGGSWKRF